MKTILYFIICSLAIYLTGCSVKSETKVKSELTINAIPENVDDPVLEMVSDSSIFAKKTNLPQSIDLNQDISNYTLQDLRLLRNYPYALKGLIFMEADISSFYTANTSWYNDLMYSLWDKGEGVTDKNNVKLSKSEQEFIDKIDKRIEELQQTAYLQKNGFRLANPSHIVNLFQFRDIDNEFLGKISQRNFVITEGNNIQLFHVYEENDYRQLPSFITTDLFLQAFHMFFSYTLKSLEQEKFIPIITELSLSMYDESMKLVRSDNKEISSMAKYNATFYAIPYYLLTGKKLAIPQEYKALFEEEISSINKNEDKTSVFLSYTDVNFPYSLFKPRGHYTRKPEMGAYFKAMMWLQTAPFCREKSDRLKQAIFMATVLNNSRTKANKPLLNLYNSVFEPIIFLIGLPDNLSVMDIVEFSRKEKINDMNTALKPENIEKVNKMLIELSKTRNEIKPKIQISCPDKINFMPQRYLIDNDVIQNLVDVTPNSNRPFPKGLDVFSAFGSQSATNVLNSVYKEVNNWAKYPEEMDKMQQKFKNYDGWNKSVYNKWIQSLTALQQPDKSYPDFMKTRAWGYKNLNTSLASWAELKHDAILYGEQPMAVECGGADPPKPIVTGYVEPNIRFWTQLSELISLTESMLKKNGLFTEDLGGKTRQLDEYVQFLINITNKELKREELSEQDFETIRYMGSSIEYFTLSVVEPGSSFIAWNDIKGPDKSLAVVADIYTRDILGCDKCGILHVATGNVNDIYVAVEINGNIYLTRGATFSYYEFVQPPGTRLTDEEWQKMLEDKKVPEIPVWMKDIIIRTSPKIDDRIFYSSGC